MSHIYSRTYAVDSRLGFNIFPKPNFPGITSREHRFPGKFPDREFPVLNPIPVNIKKVIVERDKIRKQNCYCSSHVIYFLLNDLINFPLTTAFLRLLISNAVSNSN